MTFEPRDATDAVLLDIIGQLHHTADIAAEHIATHMSNHPDHPLSECPIGMMHVGLLFLQTGAALTTNAHVMLNASIYPKD